MIIAFVGKMPKQQCLLYNIDIYIYIINKIIYIIKTVCPD